MGNKQIRARAVIAIAALALSRLWPVQAGPADPAVTQDTLAATICLPGYTRSIRHHTKHPARIKQELLAQAGLSPEAAPAYRLDHLLPLTLGGDPRDRANLAIQPAQLSYRKDRIERKLNCLVCAGQITLKDAQAAILADWSAAYHQYALVKCRRPRPVQPPGNTRRTHPVTAH